MKKVCWLLLIFSTHAFATAPVKHAAPKKQILRVAGIFPKSGPGGDFYCITKAIFEKYENPRIKISLEVFDDYDDKNKTKEIAEKIIKEKFDVVIGTRASPEALVAAPLFEAAKIPFIVPFASHPDIVNGKRHVFRLACSSARYAKLFADFTRIELKPNKVLTINNVGSPFSVYYTKKFPELLRDTAIEFKAINIKNAIPEFRDVVKTIAAEAPDLVYAPLYTEEMVIFLTALKDYKSPLVILTNGSINNGREIIRNIKLPKNVVLYFNGGWSERLSGPYKASFLWFLENKCNQYKVDLRTVSAFDSAYLLLQTLDQNSVNRGEALMRTLKAQKYQGIMGELKVDPQGDTIRPLNIFRIKDNQISFYRSYQ